MSCVSSSDVGRHLQLAIEFFDKVVPNQPGFSSSIAALTILPDVQRLSMAWKKWFRCASKVRRLNFIRKQLKKLRETEKLNEENGKRNDTSLGHSQGGGTPDWAGLGDLEDNMVQENFGEGDTSFRDQRHASTEGALEDFIRAAAIDVKQESNMEMFLDEDEIEQMTVYYREYARR